MAAADVAVIIELGPNAGKPVRRTVANGTTISKGTLCVLSDANTAYKSGATTGGIEVGAFAGIAAADKIADDGATTQAFYTEGVFDLKYAAAGALAIAGAQVVMSGINLIRAAVEADTVTGAIVGTLEESVSLDEVARVRLKGY